MELLAWVSAVVILILLTSISAEKYYCPGAVLGTSHNDAIGGNILLWIWPHYHNILGLGMLKIITKHCLFEGMPDTTQKSEMPEILLYLATTLTTLRVVYGD